MRTTMLERMVEATEGLPAAVQDDVAAIILDYLGGDQTPVDLTPDDERAIARSRQQSDLGQYVTDDQMHAIWAKYDT